METPRKGDVAVFLGVFCLEGMNMRGMKVRKSLSCLAEESRFMIGER